MLVTILAALNQISRIPLGDKITTLFRRFECGDVVKKLRRKLLLIQLQPPTSVYVLVVANIMLILSKNNNTNIMLIFKAKQHQGNKHGHHWLCSKMKPKEKETMDGDTHSFLFPSTAVAMDPLLSVGRHTREHGA